MTRGEGTGHSGLVAVLSELAARMHRARTHEDVLRIVGDGVLSVGLRFVVFQIDRSDLVLRFVATTPERQEAVERSIMRRLVGLRAPLERCGPARELLALRKVVYRNDADLLLRFIEAAADRNLMSLDGAPVATGLITPIIVRDQPWGLVSFCAPQLPPDDRAALSLFAMQVASALEATELADSLQRTEQELRSRERLATIGELAATVAHEVRNPLGVLFNSVASLRRLLPNQVGVPHVSDAEVLLSIVTEETERLNEIVTDLLELARPWALRMKEASLGTVVRTVVNDLPRLHDGSAIELQLELSDLPPIEIDPRMIRQALLNLVINAVQAMPQGGTLRLETRMEHRDEVSFECVDVSDTGAGIAPEDRQHILEPFYTTKPAGTGLGLALVKRVVEAHHGELEIASDPAGTTFTVRIPIPQWDDSHVMLKREAVAARPLRVVGTAR